MICPTVHLPGHIPPLKSADECGRKWSALCLSAYRAIHRMLVLESLRWRDSNVHIERPMETDGGQGRLDKPLLYHLWKHVRYFSACHRLWYKLLRTQKRCHAQRKRDKWFVCCWHGTLALCVSHISWILLSMSPPQTLIKNVSTRQISAHSLCYCVKFLNDF